MERERVCVYCVSVALKFRRYMSHIRAYVCRCMFVCACSCDADDDNLLEQSARTQHRRTCVTQSGRTQSETTSKDASWAPFLNKSASAPFVTMTELPFRNAH